MNNNSKFQDEIGEKISEQGIKTAKKIIKAAGQNLKQQVIGEDVAEKKTEAKVDPVTGKPVPTKKMLGTLSQQVAELSRLRLKKVREELEKQRLKVKQVEQGKQVEQVEQAKRQDDVVQQTLKGSKSTGEFKGLVGG